MDLTRKMKKIAIILTLQLGLFQSLTFAQESKRERPRAKDDSTSIVLMHNNTGGVFFDRVIWNKFQKRFDPACFLDWEVKNMDSECPFKPTFMSNNVLGLDNPPQCEKQLMLEKQSDNLFLLDILSFTAPVKVVWLDNSGNVIESNSYSETKEPIKVKKPIAGKQLVLSVSSKYKTLKTAL